MAAPWTHDADDQVKDPINLIFRGSEDSITAQDVASTLKSTSKWKDPFSLASGILTTASPQFLHEGQHKHQQRIDLVTRRVNRRYRHHIRIWDPMPDETECLASAHYEVLSLRRANHVAISFERGEKRVMDDLLVAQRSIQYDEVDLRNPLQVPDNNGWASIATV